ncbi:MAG TPA: TPM domain-containing protein [archaeon]|nr:TPM domain-containing protein [archaeon]
MRAHVAVVVLVLALIALPGAGAQLPAPRGYVNDLAGVLANGPELERALAALEEETSVEIAVVTVPRIPEGYDVNGYAVELFEQWGIGQKGKDNGLLLLLSTEDKHWRIEVGYGLEPTITDAEAGRIGRETLGAALENGEYSRGVTEAVRLLAEEVTSAQSWETTPGPMGIDWQWWLIGGGIAVVAIAVAVLTGNGWVVWIIVQILLSLVSGGKFGGGKSGGGGAGDWFRGSSHSARSPLLLRC